MLLQKIVGIERSDCRNKLNAKSNMKSSTAMSIVLYPREDLGNQVSSAVLREDIANLRDFIERLMIEEDQAVLDMDQIAKLKLELTFLSACLQLSYYISDGFNDEMSCISYEVHDLVQSQMTFWLN
ncbi:hypothetical protein T459_34999 [Capsicum annuum]|uniref:Uncharacterized protein n=1 Tax=Capsicum annuum TaxID=4072 RepID=A0A2G2XUL0_CAPAN|nr:hypothetical protein T459_34999 [Capsicum annuum]